MAKRKPKAKSKYYTYCFHVPTLRKRTRKFTKKRFAKRKK